MPIYTDSCDNIIAQITDKGRNLSARAPIEQTRQLRSIKLGNS